MQLFYHDISSCAHYLLVYFGFSRTFIRAGETRKPADFTLEELWSWMGCGRGRFRHKRVSMEARVTDLEKLVATEVETIDKTESGGRRGATAGLTVCITTCLIYTIMIPIETIQSHAIVMSFLFTLTTPCPLA
jgi:hypothetical protein